MEDHSQGYGMSDRTCSPTIALLMQRHNPNGRERLRHRYRFCDACKQWPWNRGLPASTSWLARSIWATSRKDDPESCLQIALNVLHDAQEGPGTDFITYQGVIQQFGSFAWTEKNGIG